MAKLPDQQKILPESFPQQKWLPALLSPINRFFEDVIRALNKQITIKDNLDGDIIRVTIDGSFPLDVRWSRSSPPTVAWIGQCRETSGNHTTITSAIYLDWEFTSTGAFRINNIAGLTTSPSAKFNLTIIALNG